MYLKHIIQLYLIKTVLIFSKIMPRILIFKLCNFLGLCIYLFDSKRRKLCFFNLKTVYPHLTKVKIKHLSIRIYKNFSDNLAHSFLMLTKRISKKELLDSVKIEGLERLNTAIKENEKIIIYSAHIGNWELIPQILSLLTSKRVNIIARKFGNPLIENHVIKPFRERFNVNTVYKENALLRIIKGINRGEIGGILIDQNQRNNEGIEVLFFNKIAQTTPTVSSLQIKYNALVFPMFMIKENNNSFKFIIQDPITFNDSKEDINKQVLELTSLQQQSIENIILEYPDQWLWMHNRWNVKKDLYESCFNY